MRTILILLLSVVILTIAVPAQTDDDVGDLGSFNKDAKFFGYAATGSVVVTRDCAPVIPQLGHDDRCFALNANNIATFDARDIGRIKFPKKTFENVIFLVSRNQIIYLLTNPSSTQNRAGRLVYAPYFTIVSHALDDPSLINPQTGQSFNGQLDLTQAGARNFVKLMFPGYMENDVLTYGASSISGISRKYLRDNFGLPSQVIDDFFYGEITIQLNIRGTTTNVEEGSFNWAARFLGN